jgi:hypothetical protein
VEEPPELILRCSLNEALERILRWKALKMTMFRISAPLNLSKRKLHLMFGHRNDIEGSFDGLQMLMWRHERLMGGP